jgi:hypothetical protein
MSANVMAAPPGRAPLARQDRMLVWSILLAGVLASFVVNTSLLLPTLLMVLSVMHMGRRATNAKPAVAADTVTRNLPRDVDRVVRATMAELTDGEARLLLAAIVHHADMLFARRESAFDAGQDATTQRHVTELVTAACATARELANLDASRTTVGAAMGTPTAAQLDLSGRLESARSLLANRLSDAADALRALYAAGVERGTPASDRVAELAAELRGDASSRGAALADLHALLDSSLERRTSKGS